MTQSTEIEIRDLILSLDKKFDVFAARTEEKLTSIDQRLERLEKRVDSQDNRLWAFVAAAFLTVLGFLAKLAFFPGGAA
ncbi:hypothetical protein DO97_15835 [Neosynechococcus sphagnicola sy1]|uniref:Uncharacterized protein n=1 Tax=Neosynechococcus sphagnicola sy1 TaxID=1497020 RepID=A0A098TIE1_9CYAN|nr:hypothetical protein [Neosynechococcus sphagnicola]KGF71747.1 hypothetical protein DO97_15835 [Neosynechococcus sphagnicola sy1]